MQSKAATVEEYIKQLPPERQEAIRAIREVILKNLDKDYQQVMQCGMIGYVVPHSVYPDGYPSGPRQPLPFVGLASQKNHLSLHLMCLYSQIEQEKWFFNEWEKSGKKLDMGKCCVLANKLEGFALDVIGKMIRRMPVKKYVEYYEASLQQNAIAKVERSAARKATSKSTQTKVKSRAKSV